MNIWWIIRTELRRLLRSRISRAALIVGIIIPLLYSGLYLYAFWDPYGSMEQFPVALVNQDRGGERDGKPVNYGQDIVEELTDDGKVDWQVLRLDEARDGLEHNNFYLMVAIPPDFTNNVLSIDSDTPHQARLQFTANEGENYIASTISGRLETQLREELGNKFTEEYLKGIFNVIGEAGDGLSKAASGANDLADGAVKLEDGAHDAADGSRQVADGAQQVANGSQQLANGAKSLQTGVVKAYDGAGQVKQGVASLATGSQKLADGLTESTAGVKQVRDQLGAAVTGTEQMQAGLGTMEATLGQLGADGQPQAPTTQDPAQMPALDMLGLLEQKYDLARDPLFLGALQKINGVSDGLASAKSGAGESRAGLQKAVGALDQIAKGQDRLVAGANDLASGGKQLQSGAERLASGLNDLRQGTATLATKSGELANGSRRVAQGSQDLADGTSKLADGSSDLAQGSQTLAGELTRASEAGTVKNPDAKAALMADPVTVADAPLHPVATYGMGFAAYFIPLSMWVGALMLYFVLSVREYRWLLTPVSSTSLVLGKFGTLAVVGLLQAVLSSFVLHSVLGLEVTNLVAFYLFNILIAWTSIAIIGLLIARFGTGPGRFLAILLLVLQLTSSAGTFPIELVPGIYQAIHPFLPMTYGVEGLRAIIATGDEALLWRSVGIIGGLLIAVLAVQILTTRRTLRVQDLHEKDELAG